MLKEPLIFIAGAAIGGAITYAVVNDKFQKRYEADWKELHDRMNDIRREDTKEAAEPEETTADLHKNVSDICKAYGSDAVIPTRDPFPMEASSDLPNDISEEDLEEHPVEGPAEAPQIITEREFSEKKMWYDKIELYYHGIDGVLVDDCEDPVHPDVYDLIGSEAITELRETKDNVYIRNEKAAQDYMIIYCNSSYADTHDTL